ncbi:hypothetical protein FVR03_23475 [Pontibacter qinzhouensis]|uniref:Uncharacterized protein n=1 Tax=Pontibacter qinzhouensis TaxID=2603253 RepID=A0A5C8IJT9_9BACT|nr:hypothetical protein [Pontibacter qinzhouensis]TXK21246.1 hypothetical protein FVR03_23475 [Pontibacter qinzhouensis]
MKELLLKYCPFIYKLLEKDRKVWKRVEKFQSRFENLTSNGNPNQNIPIHCIYDWMALAELGNKQAIDFLKFIDTTAIKATEQLSEKFSNAVKEIVSEIIKAFDTDLSISNNPAYLNYIGELVGLQAITNPGNKKFELLEREYKLPNNLSADFYFLDLETSKTILVDFVSIHNIKPERVGSPDNLKFLLLNRINKKLESKTINLTKKENKVVLEGGQEINFAILPILWNELADLKLYSEVFRELDKNYLDILPCCSLVPSVNENGDYEFEFKTLSSIYEFYSIN